MTVHQSAWSHSLLGSLDPFTRAMSEVIQNAIISTRSAGITPSMSVRAP